MTAEELDADLDKYKKVHMYMLKILEHVHHILLQSTDDDNMQF